MTTALVFGDIESATRGTSYAATIAPFKRTRNGRAAFMAIKGQHAGPAMWDKEVRKCQDLLLNRKFTGGTTFPLEKFLSQHRAAYVSLQRCAENVPVELPNERTRVKYLIDNIEVNDSDVKAAIAAIKMDDREGGLRSDFERSVALLLPVDPVAKRQKGKRTAAEISTTNGKVKTSRGGKTGVELRYYTPKEFAKLSEEEKTELRELRVAAKKGKQTSSTSKKNAKFRASVVKAAVKQIREEEEEKAEKASTIDAITGILKLNASSVTSAAKGSGDRKPSATAAQLPAKKVQWDGEVDDQCEVAAAKLFALMNSKMSGGRQGGKGN